MTEPRLDWHASSRADVLAELGSGGDGLTAQEARARLATAGPNCLPEATGPSAAHLLLAQVRSPLILALVAAGALALALGEWEDGAVVLAVVALNTLIGFAQDYRAGRAIAALSALVAEPARVRRDGAWTAVPAEEVVTGDLLEVAQGDRVVADLRILDAAALRAEEAPLTGESEPVDKSVAAVPVVAPLAERSSLLYAGTLVAAGSGRGVAVATGVDTELGRISAMLGNVETLETPLTRDLDRFGRTVTGVIVALAVAVAGIAAARGFAAVEAAMAGISLAVAAVPEGLPTVVTIALAVGARRMAIRRAIVRRLPAVETLGAATVVASDKTGTLTRNRMRVEAIWAPGDAAELRLAGVLCNDAEPGLGDPTETALLDAAQLDVARVRAERPRRATLPFDASRKLMATLHGATAYVKGAPEAVLPLCCDGELLAAEVDRQTALGRRVLVFAARDDAADLDALHDLRVLGVQALVDPPRDGARDAVAACQDAGVRVVMVTGDHPRTARAIGAMLGIAADDVHARVEPEGKLRLVRDLQAAGEVVAVTGDGVNDAPALRQADIGVAMGRGGTAAAREAADMVLADDDISTLRAAIEEGRRAYDNLVKALAFVLPTSLGQALIIAFAVLVFPPGRGLPVTPVQILWINLIVAVALALPLAFEAPEPDVMRRPPRRPGAPLLDRAMIVRTLLVSATLTAVALGLFELARHDGASLARAQTTAVTGAVILQAFYLLACRSLTRPNRELGRWSNPAAYVGIGIVLALQAVYVYAPFMQTIFGSAPLGAGQIVVATAAAVTVLPVAGAEEWLRRRSAREQLR
jgi:calcium-translocating P-type ATPase